MNIKEALKEHDTSLLFGYDYQDYEEIDEKEKCESCDKELTESQICISKYNETFCCECLEFAEKERA